MPVAFAARLWDRVGEKLEARRLQKLDAEKKRALLRLLHAVALADGTLSLGEEKVLSDIAKNVGVDWAVAAKMPLHGAVTELAKDPAAMKLACLVVADAFFADEDYDDAEKNFVITFAEKYSLPSNPLREAVDALRKKTLDDALTEWSKQI